MALVGTKEQLCCLSAAPLDVFWGKTHLFSVLLGCTVGQKPTQLKWHCLWWLNCGSRGCKGGGGTRYPAGRPPGSTEYLCTSASMPTPGILTKLLTSSGGPRGEPGANVHDLALNYCPMAASFVWAAPVLHGHMGSGSRHPSTDGTMLSNSSPSAAPGEKKHVLRYFKLLAPFFPFAHSLPPASILLKKGRASQGLETPEVVVFSGGSGRAMVPKQMS